VPEDRRADRRRSPRAPSPRRQPARRLGRVPLHRPRRDDDARGHRPALVDLRRRRPGAAGLRGDGRRARVADPGRRCAAAAPS
jgi:hypothetical protein